MCRTKLLAALILACCLNPAAYAEQGDRDKEMTLTADHCGIEGKTGKRRCTGRVMITQGTMKIQADSLLLSQDENNEIKSVQGEGKPVKFKQKLDKSEDWLDAESLRFEYDSKKGLVILMDEVKVHKGQDQATATKITYDLNTEKYELFGAPNVQTKLVIQPKKKEAQVEK